MDVVRGTLGLKDDGACDYNVNGEIQKWRTFLNSKSHDIYGMSSHTAIVHHGGH